MLPIKDLKYSASSSSNTRYSSSHLLERRFPDYVRRLLDVRQMDFEAAFDQLITLFSTEPQQIYTSFYYRKRKDSLANFTHLMCGSLIASPMLILVCLETKNQWARDDPAFVVIQAIFVATSALAYAIAFRHPSFWGYLWSVIYCLLVDWLFIGFAVASTCSHVANKYMRHYHSHSVEQDVEWLYCFDVHSNAFFCSFLLTYVLQYLLLPIILSRSMLSCILSNTLYAVATVWYAYISHLGYRALPFLANTQTFLWYPTVIISGLWCLSVIMVLCGLRINLSRVIMAFHYG